MVGFTYKYFGFAAYKEQVTTDLVEALNTRIDRKLNEMSSAVTFEIVEGFLFFNIHSIETVYYDLMESTFDYFIEKMKENGALVVGYCQNYSVTLIDVPFYDEIEYKVFGDISDYQFSQLKQLIVKHMTYTVAYDALQECQWRGYAENYKDDVLLNYLAAIFRLEEECCLYEELYIKHFDYILTLLIDSLGEVYYSLSLEEDTIVNNLFEQLSEKSSVQIAEYMQALFEEEECLTKMYEELNQYYEMAKNDEIRDKIDIMSASELRELYKNTYNLV